MNTIEWSRKALKQLKNLPLKDADKIVDTVDDLERFPDCSGVKPLTRHRYDFRLRVGRYRVMFNFDGGIKVVHIEEVLKRDERTY